MNKPNAEIYEKFEALWSMESKHVWYSVGDLELRIHHNKIIMRYCFDL